MDWIPTKKRGSEWKQSWALSSVSAPPLPLIAVFSIVIFLLSLSQYNSYKEQVRHTFVGFKILLFLVPVLIIFSLRTSLVSGGGWWLSWRSPAKNVKEARVELGRGVARFPWGVAAVVVVMLVLVSYQSSFQSKWFHFGSSDW